MLCWLRSLFTAPNSGRDRSRQRTSLTKLDDLLKTPGKACSEVLLSFANSVSMDEFIDTVPFPALVGSAIRDGKIEEPVEHGNGTSSFKTFVFSSSEVDAIVKGESINQSINPASFIFKKNECERNLGGAKLRRRRQQTPKCLVCES